MVIKKCLSALLCASVMLITASCGAAEQSSSSSSQTDEKQSAAQSSAATKGEIAMPVNSVKLLGRTFVASDGKIWMGLSGTGVEFEYTGEKLTVSLAGNGGSAEHISRVGIFVDGNRTSDITVNEKGKTVEIDGKGSSAVNVKIVKLSECVYSCCAIVGIDAHGGTLSRTADKPRRIEFIGDSITCGYGVDDTDLSHGFSTATEDCTKSYAYKTAQALNADYSLFSFSGYGIVSGYTDTGDKKTQMTVPQYYESYGFTSNYGYDGAKPSDKAWDFSRFIPDVIVVYLGTNDSSYTGRDSVKQSEYTREYVRFLKQIRAKNPKAKIICTLGTMGNVLSQAMKNAAAQYSAESDDNNITTLDLPLQNPQTDGMAINGHPTEITYNNATIILTQKIKSEMNW